MSEHQTSSRRAARAAAWSISEDLRGQRAAAWAQSIMADMEEQQEQLDMQHLHLTEQGLPSLCRVDRVKYDDFSPLDLE